MVKYRTHDILKFLKSENCKDISGKNTKIMIRLKHPDIPQPLVVWFNETYQERDLKVLLGEDLLKKFLRNK